MSNANTTLIVSIRKNAQSSFKNKDLKTALSLYTRSLFLRPNDPFAYAERGLVYRSLKYHELALVDALRANEILDDHTDDSLKQFLTIVHAVDVGLSEPNLEDIERYLNITRKNIYFCITFALTDLGLYYDSIEWYKKLENISSNDEKNIFKNRRLAVETKLANESGTSRSGYLSSTARYYWDEHDLRRKNSMRVLTNVNQQIGDVSGSSLTVRKMPGASNLQFGVFATDAIYVSSYRTFFTETDIVCVNTCNPSHPACDRCNITLSESRYKCPYPSCQTVFCMKQCYDAAWNSYHGWLCGKDLSPILSNISLDSTTRSLIPLLILKLFSITKSTSTSTRTNPLELPFVQNLSTIEYEPPKHRGYDMRSFRDYTAIVKILDISDDVEFDYWVFMTLDNILMAHMFAYKTPAGIPWNGFVFPLVSMINHSCTPNAQLELDGSISKLVPLRDIMKNEEIHISYINSGPGTSKDERQEILYNGWGFVCRCERCV